MCDQHKTLLVLTGKGPPPEPADGSVTVYGSLWLASGFGPQAKPYWVQERPEFLDLNDMAYRQGLALEIARCVEPCVEGGPQAYVVFHHWQAAWVRAQLALAVCLSETLHSGIVLVSTDSRTLRGIRRLMPKLPSRKSAICLPLIGAKDLPLSLTSTEVHGGSPC